ncbi:MAG: D-aminoacyl-tRNA deacylase [Methanocellales archaeon]|nr:D-aminoacyl-tRNA deacylase [Methanocellales archaeon]MDD3421400.1 D-aminoacyl-tRNA deacylase [Methanocellales archaeon]MDD4897769.1 D-aminoacyl-tRNA deacylase [Methanocellales archaeon]MDD5446595.1 D-aminoacyl-tRNA deacylase [Methanocellales archaeon]
MNITIVSSLKDPASVNIRNKLLESARWKSLDKGYEYKGFRLIEIDASHLYQDGIDGKMEDEGIQSDLIIFVSRHEGKDKRSMLTVHFTGNISDAKFGGQTRELAVAAPLAARALLLSLKSYHDEVTMEATHHGPSSLHTPSLYVEIGSTKNQWYLEAPARTIANAILTLKVTSGRVAIGLGGSHYARRLTKLIFDSDIAFGHIFPDYALYQVDEFMLQQAFEKSGTSLAYFDPRTSAQQRDRLCHLIQKLGCTALQEGDIRANSHKNI